MSSTESDDQQQAQPPVPGSTTDVGDSWVELPKNEGLGHRAQTSKPSTPEKKADWKLNDGASPSRFPLSDSSEDSNSPKSGSDKDGNEAKSGSDTSPTGSDLLDLLEKERHDFKVDAKMWKKRAMASEKKAVAWKQCALFVSGMFAITAGSVVAGLLSGRLVVAYERLIQD